MIPEVFAHSTIDREGETGAAWLCELAEIVEDLLARWEARSSVCSVRRVSATLSPAVHKHT